MRLLALDLSTHTGYAGYEQAGKPTTYGTFHVDIVGEYPWAHLDAAGEVAQRVVQIAHAFQPELIVVEETSRGYGHAQKVLEFIHCRTLLAIREEVGVPVKYLLTGQWRSALGLRLSKEQKDSNKLARAANAGTPCPSCVAKTGKKRRGCGGCGGKGVLAKSPAERAAAKAATGVRGVVNFKHLSVNWANETFGLSLRRKDDGTADALALGQAFYILVSRGVL